MIFDNVNRKLWERYESSNYLYQEHPVRYRCQLFFLLLQSSIVSVLILGGILLSVWLFVKHPENSLVTPLAIILGVNLIITIAIYVFAFFSRPWNGMLYLSPQTYPHFYRKVNWIANLMQGPKIHRIYLSADFNASVCSAFIFFPGLRRNVLIIGYPLLCAFSSKAIIAALAHEIGHMAKGHLSLNNIFSHIELFWRSLHLGIFNLFLNPWRNYFLRSLTIMLHPLRYEHEKEADSVIGNRFGPEYHCEGLVQLLVKGKIFEKDKTLLHAMLAAESVDRIDFATITREMVRKKLSPDEWRRLLNEALCGMPPVFDEHPPFKERIGNHDAEELLPYLLSPPNALERLLAPRKGFELDVNRYYQNTMAEVMNEVQTSGKDFLRKRTEFNPNAEYSADEVAKYVDVLEFFDQTRESELLIEKALTRYPDSSSLQGMQLLRKLRHATTAAERHKIIIAMEELIKKTPLTVFELHDQLMQYYLESGMNDRIKNLLDLRRYCMDQEHKRLNKKLAVSDHLRPANLSDGERASLREIFAMDARVIEAIYPIERVYDDNVLMCSRFVVVHKKHRSFVLRQSDSDFICNYEDMDFKVVIGSMQMLQHLESLNVEPITIAASDR